VFKFSNISVLSFPFLAINPSKLKRSVGKPDKTKAEITALGPGIIVMSIFSSIAGAVFKSETNPLQ